MFEKSAPGDAHRSIRLVVVLRLEQADTRLGFYSNLRQRVVIDACSEDLPLRPLYVSPAIGRHKTVVVVIASKEEKPSYSGAPLCQGKQVDTGFKGGVPGRSPTGAWGYGLPVIVVWFLLREEMRPASDR